MEGYPASGFLDGPAAHEAFGSHDTLPPTIGEGETRQSLQARIDSMRSIARNTTDLEMASRLINEAGLLEDELNSRPL